jgi:hypothetical protein
MIFSENRRPLFRIMLPIGVAITRAGSRGAAGSSRQPEQNPLRHSQWRSGGLPVLWKILSG